MQKDDMYTIRTADDNEELELLKLVCTNCGANLEIQTKVHAKCPYCGQQYKIEEANGKIIHITVDYNDAFETEKSVKNLRRLICIFAIIAIVIAFGIIEFNYFIA